MLDLSPKLSDTYSTKTLQFIYILNHLRITKKPQAREHRSPTIHQIPIAEPETSERMKSI